jgi:hypothetical protein
MNWEIYPGIGVGELTFGADRVEVQQDGEIVSIEIDD